MPFFPGYLAPAVTSPPLEGEQLQDFFHDVIAGVSGLDGKFVRPRWLTEPSNIPAAGTAWCAFGIMNKPADTFAYLKDLSTDDNPQAGSTLQRQQTLNVLCSFYDLGSSGLADQLAGQTRDGLAVPQNLEVLLANGFAFVNADEPQPVPSLLKERWLYRVDLPLVFRRQIDRTYAVPTIESSDIDLITDVPPTTTHIHVEPPTEP